MALFQELNKDVLGLLLHYLEPPKIYRVKVSFIGSSDAMIIMEGYFTNHELAQNCINYMR